MSIQGKVFTEAFNSVKKVVPFDTKWMNGTGYFDGVVHMVKLAVGEMAKSTDEVGRRLIMVGTRFGTVVVFDRYNEQNNDGIWVTNKPSSAVLRELMSGTNVGLNEMVTIVGGNGNLRDNIGYTIERMAKELKVA